MKKALIASLAVLVLLFTGCTAQGGSSMHYAAAPEAAFAGLRSGRVEGGTPDGSRLLIDSAATDLILWDVKKGERIPISFPRAQDAQAIVTGRLTSNAVKLGRDQRDQYLQKQQEAVDAYLSKQGLETFETLDQIQDCLGNDGPAAFRTRCIQNNEGFALVYYGSFCLGINLDTGVSYLVEGLQGINPVLCGSEVLCSEGFLDLATGQAAAPDLGADQGIERGIERAVALTLLPEHRFLGVYGTAWLKQDNNLVHEEYLILRSLESELQCISLGECNMSESHNTVLVTADEQHALVFNATGAHTFGVKLADLKTGEIRQIEDLLPVAAAENRFLCYDYKNHKPCLLDPATGKTVAINTSVTGSDPKWLGPVAPFMNAVFNGRLLFPQNETYQGYLVLE